MSDLQNLLGMIGDVGNAAGVQGSGIGNLNLMQRMALSPEQQAGYNAQSALATLPSSQDFQAMDIPGKQAKIASITGKPEDIQGAIASSSLKGLKLDDPDLIPNLIKTGNTPGLDALAKLNPLLQTQRLQQIANGGNQPQQPPQAAPANAMPAPAALPSTSGQPKASNADTFINNTLGLEGGMSSDGKSAFGIDGKANPEAFAQAKQIQQTKGDAAAKAFSADFLKKNYYDPHASDIEGLSPQQGQVVFDSFVNHRSDFANQVLGAAKAGASPDQLLGMRQQEYQRLAASDADKPANEQQYAPNLPGWNNRLTNLRAQVGQIGQPQGQGYAGMAGKLPQPANQNAPQQEMNPVTNQPYQPWEPKLSPEYQRRARVASALTQVMGVNGDQARAAVQSAEQEPSYQAWQEATKNHYKAAANMQEKGNDDNIEYEKELQGGAENGIGILNSTREIESLGKYFQAGKLAPTQNLISAWKVALDIGSPEDATRAAAMSATEKLNFQNTVGLVKGISSRPSQMEFMKGLEVNPGIIMTPEARALVIKNMQNTGQNAIDKFSAYTQYRDLSENKGNPEFHGRDFENTWAKQQQATAQSRIVTPDTIANPPPGKLVGTVGGKKLYELPNGKGHVMEK